jgi:hypothetical protein
MGKLMQQLKKNGPEPWSKDADEFLSLTTIGSVEELIKVCNFQNSFVQKYANQWLSTLFWTNRELQCSFA